MAIYSHSLKWIIVPLLAIVLVSYYADTSHSGAPWYLVGILLIAPLLLIPLAFHLISQQQNDFPSNFLALSISSWLLAPAYWSAPGWLGGSLALPYLVYTVWVALTSWRMDSIPPFVKVALHCLPVAAAWLLADRTGWRPLGFNPLIVLLTAIHFHYAGFMLAFIASWVTSVADKPWSVVIYLLGLAGVAVGITVTQVGGPVMVESLATTIMASFGLWIAWQLWRSQLDLVDSKLKLHWLLRFSAIALALGMLLALAYGWRLGYIFPWLTIPFMYATHGILNSIGFALPALLSVLKTNKRFKLF